MPSSIQVIANPHLPCQTEEGIRRSCTWKSSIDLRVRKVLFILHQAIYSTAQSCKALPVQEYHLPARDDGQTSQLAPETRGAQPRKRLILHHPAVHSPHNPGSQDASELNPNHTSARLDGNPTDNGTPCSFHVPSLLRQKNLPFPSKPKILETH